MMNFRLYLMRHGQAEYIEKGYDFQRCLTDFGRQQIIRSGNFLSQYQVDKIITSYVRRTMQTASIIKGFVNTVEEEVVEYLYKYKAEDYYVIKMLSEQADLYKHILVIGHNPTIYNLAIHLLDNDSDGCDRLLNIGMEPGQVVVIEFPKLKSWSQLTSVSGKLVELFKP